MPGALDNIRVVDFSWVIAGPAFTRCLADYGAEVFKIESTVHPHIERTSPPYKDNKAGLNRSGLWPPITLTNMGMSLNINHPKGIELAKRLIAKSDVVVENFVPEQWENGVLVMLTWSS